MPDPSVEWKQEQRENKKYFTSLSEIFFILRFTNTTVFANDVVVQFFGSVIYYKWIKFTDFSHTMDMHLTNM